MRSTATHSGFLVAAAAYLALASACSKPSSEEQVTPTTTGVVAPADVPAASAVNAASLDSGTSVIPNLTGARSAAPVAPSSVALHTGPSVAASASAVPTASASVAAAPTTPALMQNASISASGSHYALTVTARDNCTVNTDCTGTITLAASGGYHINDEYPYRFVVDDVSGATWVTPDGKGFGKTTGDFKKTSATTADLSIRYKGTQPVVTRLSGTYKMSVCSEANCQVETVPLALNVTFKP